MSTPLPPTPEPDGVPGSSADDARPGPAGPQGAPRTGPPNQTPQGAPYTGPHYQSPQGAPYTGPRYQPPQGAPYTGPQGTPYTGPQPTPSAPDQNPPPRRGHAMSSFFDSLRRTGLVRTEERWVGGVCGGLARRLGVDPALVRAATVVLSVFTGLGLVLYGLGWALLPEERDGRIHLEQAVSGDLDPGFAGAVGTFVAGLALFDHGVLPTWYLGLWGSGGVFDAIWSALWVGVVIVVIVAVLRWFLRRDERRARPTPPAGAYRYPVPPGHYSTTAQGEPVLQAGSAPGGPGTAPATPTAPGHGPHAAPPTDTQASSPAWSPVAAPTTPVPVVGGPLRTSPAVPTVYPGPGARPDASPYAAPGPVSVPPQAGPVPPRPAPPVRPRVPGPGRTLSLVVLGCVLLVLAGTALAAYQGDLGFLGAPLVACGAVVVVLGTGVLVSALRGRRGGWMSALGVLALVAGLPALVAGSALPSSVVSMGAERPFGTVRATYEDSEVSVGTGAVDLDLRSMPEDAPARTVHVSVGAGDVDVHLTSGQAVRIVQTQGAGGTDVGLFSDWTMAGSPIDQGGWDSTSSDELGWYAPDGTTLPQRWFHDTHLAVDDRELASSQVANGTTPQVTVVVEIGAGTLRVEENPTKPAWSGIKDHTAWVVQQWTDSSGRDNFDLPVPGMTHATISWDDAWTCLRDVDDDPATSPDLYTLESMTGTQRTAYDACVTGVLAGEDAEEAASTADGQATAQPTPAGTAPATESTATATP